VEFNNPNDFSSALPEEDNNLVIHYLPQGCAVAESGGQTVLLDGCADEGSESVIKFLKDELGVERLSQIVVPNTDPGRYGGVKAIMDAIPTALVIIPNSEQPAEFADFVKSIGGGMTVIPLRAGNTFNIGANTVTVVGPIVEEGGSAMDTSLMHRVTCGDTAFLFTNDTSKTEAETLLASPLEIQSDVVFVNSNNDSTLPSSVMRLVSPSHEVVSDHKTAPDMKEFSVEVHDTNEGPITVRSDGNKITFDRYC